MLCGFSCLSGYLVTYPLVVDKHAYCYGYKCRNRGWQKESPEETVPTQGIFSRTTSGPSDRTTIPSNKCHKRNNPKKEKREYNPEHGRSNLGAALNGGSPFSPLFCA